MQLPPLEVLQSWPKPNYVDPVTRGWENRIIIILVFPLVLVIVGIRIFTRLRISRSFGVDDWLIIAALFPTSGFMAISLLVDLKFHWNRHIWDVPVPPFVAGLKSFIATQIFFSLSSTLTKCSMLTLVYRIVSKRKGYFPKLVLGAMVVFVVQSLLYCFMVVFQCHPISDYWALHFGPQHNCINQPANLLAAGIINTVSDLITVLLPIPTIANLQLPRRQQVVVIALFAAGGLVTAAGAVRTYFTWEITTNHDASWYGLPVLWSSSLELYVGIICASIPASKLFFTVYLPTILKGKIFSTFHSISNRLTTDESSHPSPSHSSTNKDQDPDLELGTITRPKKTVPSREFRKSFNTKLLSPLHTHFTTSKRASESPSNGSTSLAGSVTSSGLGDMDRFPRPPRPISERKSMVSAISDLDEGGESRDSASSRSSRGEGGDRVLDSVSSKVDLVSPVSPVGSVKGDGSEWEFGRMGGGPMGGLGK